MMAREKKERGCRRRGSLPTLRRKALKGVGPNDRGQDRELEQTLKRMSLGQGGDCVCFYIPYVPGMAVFAPNSGRRPVLEAFLWSVF